MDTYFTINRPHGTTSVRTPNTSIITSRGCPAKCIFCSIHSVWGRKFRARSPESVLEEIRHLRDDYGIQELQFEDDNLTFDATRAKSIFQGMIDLKFDILWTTPNGVAAYALDDETLELMKKSGCYRICLAIESGNKEVLNKIIRKPLRLPIVKPLIAKVKDLGIAVDAFFVVGFPGETREQMADTFKFANGIGAENVNFFIATPYPGTKLYDVCREKGCYRPRYLPTTRPESLPPFSIAN
ncbi:MAG: radical SAM protein [Candidatus Aquicultor sp.]|nr:radical SAM protein [Candidatus Aquicultor sp.]